MSIKKGIYRVKDDSGQYIKYHLETDANLVIENTSKKFVSESEKTNWNAKADSNHTHNNYLPSNYTPTWASIQGKPSFATVATSGNYNDLSNKPTINPIDDSTTTSTTNTWSAKKINDSLANLSGENHTHTASQITGLGTAATKNTGVGSGQIPIINSSGKLEASILPSIAINQTFNATSQANAMTLTVEIGDVVLVTENSTVNTYICVDHSKTVFNEKFKILFSGADSVSKAEFNTELAKKSDVSHLHDSRYLRSDTANANIGFSTSDGSGLKFWNSDSYKVYMSSAPSASWGGRMVGDSISDFNMYFRMLGLNRGYVFKTDKGNVAGITHEGDIKAKRNISIGDNKVELKFNSNTKSIDFIFN